QPPLDTISGLSLPTKPFSPQGGGGPRKTTLAGSAPPPFTASPHLWPMRRRRPTLPPLHLRPVEWLDYGPKRARAGRPLERKARGRLAPPWPKFVSLTGQARVRLDVSKVHRVLGECVWLVCGSFAVIRGTDGTRGIPDTSNFFGNAQVLLSQHGRTRIKRP